MKTFPTATSHRATRSNADIARDFIDLSFQLESGRAIPVMSRFEGPISVRVTGDVPPSMGPDLARLLSRLRREAGISISQVPASAAASITIEVVSRRDLQRSVPQAACFVVPRVASWDEYRGDRRGTLVDWTTLTTRERLAIFIPGDTSPQEIRDCLHEELAQALGPLNDLYRLPDSVFNDDNFHTVLTGFDMLVLRSYYDPALSSGMTREQVAQRLPMILARLNPAGQGVPPRPAGASPRAWIDAVEEALGPRATPQRRQAAARRAVQIAQGQGWTDNRMAFSLFALGRLSLSGESDVALASFLQARKIYDSRPETQLHAAHVAMQLAAFALSSNQPRAAIELVDGSIAPVAEAENAALYATLLMIKAEALDLLGEAAQARAVRLDSLGWARYGFGADAAVRERASEIAQLSPRNRTGG
nr:DUF2927 domain-containing protein [Anianabacter salinae]